MKFVDEIKLHMKAGDGGDGVVRWLHLKGKEYSGPSGGDGGEGGSVYVEAVRDLNVLYDYKNIKQFNAEDGESGRKNSQHGRSGQDLIVKLPIGSVVENLDSGEKIELLKEGQRELLLKGGRGGLGNEHFKSSTNVRPEESTPGRSGQEADFYIEIRLMVDAGFVGFPNAGKSTLLNELTGARSKVGAYQFTTLDPSLGNLYGYILADIPGLIEGAALGKGLGHKFLRHIQRTKMIIHLISVENEDVLSAYKTIRGELEKYSSQLAEKKEMVVLSKTDLVSSDEVTKKIDELKSVKKEVYSVTAYDNASIKDLSDAIVKSLNENE